MELTAIVIGLALLEYTVFTMLCGRARARCGVVAPPLSPAEHGEDRVLDQSQSGHDGCQFHASLQSRTLRSVGWTPWPAGGAF